MKIAFQGETGAFSEEAVCALFPGEMPVALPSFDAVFEAVERGTVGRGVVPIENSLFGSVHVNYDLLRSHDLRIVAEMNLRVRHNLLVLSGVGMEEIRQVWSHPQALGQCRDFLRTHLAHAEAVPAYDTAGAAKMVAEQGRRETAAIASAQAAAEYDLEMLATGIESNHQNFTRFLALARSANILSGDGLMKTSILYAQRKNVPGWLFKSLAVFALRDIDLLKIESRPLVGRPGRYLFYLDFEGSVTDVPVQRALEHLEEIAAFVRVLGSYRPGDTVA